MFVIVVSLLITTSIASRTGNFAWSLIGLLCLWIWTRIWYPYSCDILSIIKSPWHGYSHDDTHTSEHTLVLHPTLLEFMRIHGFGTRIIAEGIMFGDADRFAAMKIDMFGRTSNMQWDHHSAVPTTY